MNPVVVYTHPMFREHDTGPGHPECAARLAAIDDGITTSGLRERLSWAEATPAAPAHLRRVHTEDYITSMLALDGRAEQIDSDTRLSPGTIAAALRSAGAIIQGVDAVLGGESRYAVSLGRPPGHHATASTAMGFCFFNNVAVGAAHALANHDFERVLIIDPDVHHGNGTQDIFYENGKVWYFSVHQAPWYPGTGAIQETGMGEGRGRTVNLPLPGGMGDGDYLYALENLLIPLIDRIKPQLTFISAGFDAHALDPLADMNVTTNGFACFYDRLFRHLEKVQCPAVIALEGGYSLRALGESVPAMLYAALGETRPTPGHLHAHSDTIQLVAVAKQFAGL